MSAAAVAACIQQLDALSRERALSDKESLLLERLIRQEGSARKLPRRQRNPRKRPEPPTLEQRLQATLDSMVEDGMEPRAIYLAPADVLAASAAGIAETFRDVPIRVLKGRGRSCIYSKQGVARSLGQRGAGHIPYPFFTSSSSPWSVASPTVTGDLQRECDDGHSTMYLPDAGERS